MKFILPPSSFLAAGQLIHQSEHTIKIGRIQYAHASEAIAFVQGSHLKYQSH